MMRVKASFYMCIYTLPKSTNVDRHTASSIMLSSFCTSQVNIITLAQIPSKKTFLINAFELFPSYLTLSPHLSLFLSSPPVIASCLCVITTRCVSIRYFRMESDRPTEKRRLKRLETKAFKGPMQY